MGEAFAALGAASAFFQVVEFSAKLASASHELLRSGRDALRENITIERLVREYQALAENCNDAAERRTRSLAEIRSGTTPGMQCPSGTPEEAAARPAPKGREDIILKLGQQCHREAQNLLDELQSLRMEARNSKVKRIVEGTRKAARALARRKTIEAQQRHLQQLNSLLATHMLTELWIASATPAEIASGKSKISGSNSVEKVCRLLVEEKAKGILEDLSFPEMSSRVRSIDPAWKKTYSWALADPSHGLAQWLQEGNGIFWISGKAGSGKSTLMKYVWSHQTTQKLLKQWSGDRELVTANFFFWYAGTALQKSVEGLLRSILSRILSEIPSFAKTAFPDWNDDHPSTKWTEDTLLQALKAIIDDKSYHIASANRCFCFFIDGLDEYAGNHTKLAGLLKLLARDFRFRLKLCVSSRPWNAFRDAFGPKTPQLQLEDLTKPDITIFVGDTIKSHISNTHLSLTKKADIQGLVSEIVDRAEGVFLWVVLAVKSVCNGMTEGDNLRFLRHRVRELPSELDAFFCTILRRVEPIYLRQTYQALKLAWICARESGASSLLDAADEVGDSDTSREGSEDDSSGVEASEANAREDEVSEGDAIEDIGSKDKGNGDAPRGTHSGKRKQHDCLGPLARRQRATMDPRFHYKYVSRGEPTTVSSFIDYWLIHQYPNGLQTPNFAYEWNAGSISGQQHVQMVNETKMFLSAACKDLLCLSKDAFRDLTLRRQVGPDEAGLSQRVELLHRTVYEYLDTKTMQKLLDSNVPTHFQSRRILHLLNLRRLKHVFQDCTHTDKVTSLVTATDQSLKVAHPDLCKRYVRQFHDLGLRIHKASFWFAAPEVIATFVAFRQYDYVLKMLETGGLLRELKDSITGSYRDHLWAATLGRHPIRRFGLDRVDVDFVKKLLQYDATPIVCALPADVLLHTFAGGLWDYFLRLWRLEDPPLRGDPSSRSPKCRRVWELAKLFLDFGKSLEQAGCAGKGSKRHRHRFIAAWEYIEAHVPLEWLIECKAFAVRTEGSPQPFGGMWGGQHLPVKREGTTSILSMPTIQHHHAHSGQRDDPIPLSDDDDRFESDLRIEETRRLHQ